MHYVAWDAVGLKTALLYMVVKLKTKDQEILIVFGKFTTTIQILLMRLDKKVIVLEIRL